MKTWDEKLCAKVAKVATEERGRGHNHVHFHHLLLLHRRQHHIQPTACNASSQRVRRRIGSAKASALIRRIATIWSFCLPRQSGPPSSSRSSCFLQDHRWLPRQPHQGIFTTDHTICMATVSNARQEGSSDSDPLLRLLLVPVQLQPRRYRPVATSAPNTVTSSRRRKSWPKSAAGQQKEQKRTAVVEAEARGRSMLDARR